MRKKHKQQRKVTPYEQKRRMTQARKAWELAHPAEAHWRDVMAQAEFNSRMRRLTRSWLEHWGCNPYG